VPLRQVSGLSEPAWVFFLARFLTVYIPAEVQKSWDPQTDFRMKWRTLRTGGARSKFITSHLIALSHRAGLPRVALCEPGDGVKTMARRAHDGEEPAAASGAAPDHLGERRGGGRVNERRGCPTLLPFTGRLGLDRCGSSSAQHVSGELSNDTWDPPPAHALEISGVLRIGAEKALLHKAFDDSPNDTQAEKHDTA